MLLPCGNIQKNVLLSSEIIQKKVLRSCSFVQKNVTRHMLFIFDAGASHTTDMRYYALLLLKNMLRRL